MQCPNCGNSVPHGDIFCSNCGSKVSSASKANVTLRDKKLNVTNLFLHVLAFFLALIGKSSYSDLILCLFLLVLFTTFINTMYLTLKSEETKPVHFAVSPILLLVCLYIITT